MGILDEYKETEPTNLIQHLRVIWDRLYIISQIWIIYNFTRKRLVLLSIDNLPEVWSVESCSDWFIAHNGRISC